MAPRTHVYRTTIALMLGVCWSPVLVEAQPNATPIGHGKPLGSHMKPIGATVIGKFSSPPVFYGHFVKGSKPIHMKHALAEAKHPWEEWTDDYFRERFGTELVRVELGKKEKRNRNAEWVRFSQFLEHYSLRDLYMVHSISGPLADLVLIPPTLQCGGFQRSLQEAIMWMGKGPLKSVLHYDELDNLLCVFDGTKDVVLIDQLYKEEVESRGFDQAGHFSYVDPDAVDMKAFRQFKDMPWYRVHLEPGDCLYIPYKWYHQVSSFGNRSLAINIWFSHLWWFDDDSCGVKTLDKMIPIKKFGFASPNEATRSRWLEVFSGTDDDIQLRDFMKRVELGSDERKQQLFIVIDKDGDGTLTWEELYGFNMDQALRLFSDMFDVNAQPHPDNGDVATATIHRLTLSTDEGREGRHSMGERQGSDDSYVHVGGYVKHNEDGDSVTQNQDSDFVDPHVDNKNVEANIGEHEPLDTHGRDEL